MEARRREFHQCKGAIVAEPAGGWWCANRSAGLVPGTPSGSMSKGCLNDVWHAPALWCALSVLALTALAPLGRPGPRVKLLLVPRHAALRPPRTTVDPLCQNRADRVQQWRGGLSSGEDSDDTSRSTARRMSAVQFAVGEARGEASSSHDAAPMDDGEVADLC